MAATGSCWQATGLDARLPAVHHGRCQTTMEKGMFGHKEIEKDRRFLVVVRVDARVRIEATQWTMEQIRGISGDANRLAFSSEKGETFGVFMRAKKAAAQIRAALDNEYAKADRAFVLVVELGDDWSALNNSRGWEWLQHH